MKKAVMYGAGNIGRGFIGKVFSNSGYKVCFLDIDQDLIKALSERESYKVRIVSNEEDYYTNVSNVYGVDADSKQAIEEIANCDIMATAVGVSILPFIVPNLVAGIKLRIQNKKKQLNIILAENQIHVGQLVRKLIYEGLSKGEKEWAKENLGLVEASIGRMIPPLSDKEKDGDPLLIAVEPYCALPVDSLGFKGAIPELVGLVPFTPFDFYVKRKLFIHNMGHSICAYLGFKKGYDYVSEAIGDPDIYKIVSMAMDESVEALHKEYPSISIEEIKTNKDDLLFRFGNVALRDTIFRVAGDPLRKLRSNDRLVGAALYCLEQGVIPEHIIKGIVAGYRYNQPNDRNSIEIQQMIEEYGMEYAIEKVSGIQKGSTLGKMILEQTGKNIINL
jgi:mannitol-1-phosphate 5-dehydrogenase